MKKLLSLFLALSLLVALPLFSACHKDDEVDARVWTLNGTTGFGMAQLISNSKADSTELNYEFTVETVATNVRDALLSGTADIGAVPTNMAAGLYNASNGAIQILAINTRGVLYLVVNTARVSAPTSLADLAGKTVYVPAQNPAFIASALFTAADVNVTLDSSIADPTELRNKMAAGEEGFDYAILPEPMVTIAKANAAEGVTLTTALDLTAVWDQHFPEGSLVQGCIVARKAFIEEHPETVSKFLAEYKQSLEFVVANPKEASTMIVDAGIFAQAAVAERAIPNCNLAYIDGAAMKAAMEVFLNAMPKTSIGGKLPDAGFYYGV